MPFGIEQAIQPAPQCPIDPFSPVLAYDTAGSTENSSPPEDDEMNIDIYVVAAKPKRTTCDIYHCGACVRRKVVASTQTQREGRDESSARSTKRAAEVSFRALEAQALKSLRALEAQRARSTR